ncbi:hypothetical protein ACFL23_00810 [Patescibacteria group bacterium]
MKGLVKVCVCCSLFVIFIFSGCTNFQASNREETENVVKVLEDFKEIIQYISISSGNALVFFCKDPYVYESFPLIFRKSLNETEKRFVHLIVYRSKDDSISILFLNDKHPPKIIARIDL